MLSNNALSRANHDNHSRAVSPIRHKLLAPYAPVSRTPAFRAVNGFLLL